MTNSSTKLENGVYFTDRYDADGYISEAVVAAWAFTQDENTQWLGGNNKGIDIIWSGHTVDVKSCFVEEVRGPSGVIAPHVGFMGSKREIQVRNNVSHYALVYLSGRSRVDIAMDGSVNVSSAANPTVYLIPAEDINNSFYSQYIKDGSRPNRGLNKYFPLEDIDQWRIFGPDLTPLTI